VGVALVELFGALRRRRLELVHLRRDTITGTPPGRTNLLAPDHADAVGGLDGADSDLSGLQGAGGLPRPCAASSAELSSTAPPSPARA
jgi:hypothetical protein